MRVLITGSAGMLGRDLMAELGSSFDVVGHTRESGDLTDLAAVRGAFRAAEPTAVVNAAAMTNVDGCESDRDPAYAVNGLAARNVAVAAAELGASVLHVSTDFVFDGEKGEPYLEYDRTNPLSVYGDSKLWGERMVLDHCPRSWVVRTQWLYGAGGKNFVDTIVGRAREGHPLRVVDDQFGCPTSTVELARCIAHILAAGEGCYGIYHASGRGSCSWYEFAARAVDLAGIEGVEVGRMPSSELDRPAARPADSRLKNYHLELSIGDPMKPWDEALAEYLGTKAVA